LESYTKTKEKPQAKTKQKEQSLNKEILVSIAEINERLNYIVETLKGHAEMINDHTNLLQRIRSRMGI